VIEGLESVVRPLERRQAKEGDFIAHRRHADTPFRVSQGMLSSRERTGADMPNNDATGASHPRFHCLKRIHIVSLALFLAIAPLHSSFASDGMRCGNKLIDDGDTMEEVRAKCGEPSSVSHRTVLRRPVFYRHGQRYSYGTEMIEVPVEYWTYNFGPNKLMRRIRFVDGLVEEIETLDYGYNEDERPAR